MHSLKSKHWVVWIAVDTVYTGVFVYKHLYLTAGLYAFFVFLAVLGLSAWRQALAGQQLAGEQRTQVPSLP